jgi:acetyl/propionyl-CoA carboxylase alpha subunit/acetyl-CoA carboxylase beta subunit
MSEEQRHTLTADNTSTDLFLSIDNLSQEEQQRQANETTFLSNTMLFGDNQGGTFVDKDVLARQAEALADMTGEAYQKHVISPAESSERCSVIKLISEISARIIEETKLGPLYLAELEVQLEGKTIRLGVIAQNRMVNNGVWKPEHHHRAGQWARELETRNLAIVTFIDTPGADAGADANILNQAHSISALIATMTDLKVPTIGIVWGLGYSGGAIPLAATNLLLSVNDGIFSTIQPKGLASIARKQKLDWQTCARLVGVSAAELYQEGVLDAVIDYSPLEASKNIQFIKQAIFSGLNHLDQQSRELVSQVKPLVKQCSAASRVYAAGDEASNQQLVSYTASSYPSIFGFATSLLRTIKLRSRLKTQSVQLEAAHGQFDETILSPADQLRHLSRIRFNEWVKRSDRVIYEDELFKSWSKYKEREAHRSDDRGYMAALFLGDPKNNFDKAYLELSAEIAFYLYNGWQQEAQPHLRALSSMLETADQHDDCKLIADDKLTILDIIQDTRFKLATRDHAKNLIQFDIIYEQILANLADIVSELSDDKWVSQALLQSILAKAGVSDKDVLSSFGDWLMRIRNSHNFGAFLRTAERWKKAQHPRLSDVVFVVASYFFEKLLPEMFECQQNNKPFLGLFNPASIGRRKDFWHRLNQAIKDIRIQAILNDIKPANNFTPRALVDTLFDNFLELHADISTADPKQFPGFSASIQRQQSEANSTSGLICGTANFEIEDESETVGLFVSNHSFQAGAFDMSSAEKLCRLLAYCGQHALPVIGFISSGGMQTKEGASALFSMAVVNDHITRFVSDLGLPILLFGYGDCTGGAQASLVTHPLVDSYYFSGTNMPFAGRIVVPEYLPVTVTLANYLVAEKNSMKGLVKHPMIGNVDDRLLSIDSKITAAEVTAFDLIDSWLTHKKLPAQQAGGRHSVATQKFEPYQKVLIHARGCTAVKLIRVAHAMALNVVLVQSDPDMDSVAAELLKDSDDLVCLGGYTSDESYLNGDSVLRIAEMSGAQALHPGIGFLSENSQFAHQCIAQGLSFVGPSPESMAMMGDKSKAIETAMALGVAVVPGSHGLLRGIKHSQQIATEIGYPIILKAAHGGGGKGIAVVEKAEDLEATLNMIRAEARSSFGSDQVYLERLVTRFRHIEVQLLRDRFSTTHIIGLRDCSVQRNKQKIIEESGSTALPAEQERHARDSAQKLANACDYHGAGTVEFIYDLDRDALYFMEMNTRLQVEHPVTEMVSGVDIVKEQYRISMGEAIGQLAVNENGYAIEVRINAESVSLENGELKVQPNPGRVTKCVFPHVDGVSHIVSVAEGKMIPPFYDNLIAQIIVHADTREDAIAKMIDYLSLVVVEGVDTNIALLNVILGDEVFISGDFDTRYLEDLVLRNIAALTALKEGRIAYEDGLDERSLIKVEGSNELKVLAPSTCIVYHSASPDQPSYINEGDIICVDQTLCLLEAMKMFQPLSLSNFNRHDQEAYPEDQKYKVTHIKGVSDQQVSRGDLLFVIEPVMALA